MIQIYPDTKTVVVVGNHSDQSIYKHCKTWLFNNPEYGNFVNDYVNVAQFVLQKPWTMHRKDNIG